MVLEAGSEPGQAGLSQTWKKPPPKEKTGLPGQASLVFEMSRRVVSGFQDIQRVVKLYSGLRGLGGQIGGREMRKRSSLLCC